MKYNFNSINEHFESVFESAISKGFSSTTGKKNPVNMQIGWSFNPYRCRFVGEISKWFLFYWYL